MRQVRRDTAHGVPRMRIVGVRQPAPRGDEAWRRAHRGRRSHGSHRHRRRQRPRHSRPACTSAPKRSSTECRRRTSWRSSTSIVRSWRRATAPRERAMALLVRAARLVGPRARGGRIVVQTLIPGHEVIRAARARRSGAARRTRGAQSQRRSDCRPTAHWRPLSGAGSDEFVAGLRWRGGLGWRRALRRQDGRLDDARNGVARRRATPRLASADRGRSAGRVIRRIGAVDRGVRRMPSATRFRSERSITAPMPIIVRAITTETGRTVAPVAGSVRPTGSVVVAAPED